MFPNRCKNSSSTELRNTNSPWVFCLFLPVPTPRYEEEINKRTAAENDFVVLKKVSAEGGWGNAVRAPFAAEWSLAGIMGLVHLGLISTPVRRYYPDLTNQVLRN